MIKYFDCSVQQLQNDRLNKIEGTAKTNTVLVDDLKYKEKVSHHLPFRECRGSVVECLTGSAVTQW